MGFQTKNQSLFKDNVLENAVERPEHLQKIQFIHGIMGKMWHIWRDICVRKQALFFASNLTIVK